MALGSLPTSFCQSVQTRRVCCGEVTRMTVVLPLRRISRPNFLQLFLGIHHWPGKNMDRAFRDALVNQDLAVVVFLAYVK